MCLHVWTDFTTADSSNFDCNNAHDVGIRCVDLRHVALPTTLLSATLFLSFEVRACCDSAVDFTSKKVVFVVGIFKIEVARDFYLVSKESALPGVSVDFSGAQGELPSPRYGRWPLLAHELHRRAESNVCFVPVAQTQCPSTHADLPWKSPCRLQSCPAQELCST